MVIFINHVLNSNTKINHLTKIDEAYNTMVVFLVKTLFTLFHVNSYASAPDSASSSS